MLLTNIGRLVPIGSDPIPQAALEIENGKIKWLGPESEAPPAGKTFDCGGGVLTPGLVDCHTHLVHAGQRCAEFALRAEGKSYLEIARAGGGILATVAATRAASFESLYREAAARLEEAIGFGTTTIEIKSGYGLDVAAEIKILEVIQKLQRDFPVTIVPTFLGAHTIPAEYRKNREDYVRLLVEEMLPAAGKLGIVRFCDVFVEAEAFTPEEARTILTSAKKWGMRPKLHVDQLSAGRGAELAAELKAVSADHLENISEEGIAALGQGPTVAVLLPGASFTLGAAPAPARRLLDRGVAVALATDYNPGTNPCLNLILTGAQAVSLLKMTTPEVWRAITFHAAKALGLDERKGSLEAGKDADCILWRAPHEDFPLYRYGANCVEKVFVRGEIFK